MRRSAVAALLLLSLFAACHKKSKPLSTNLNAENKVEMRSVDLYYESPQMFLSPEQRSLPLPQNPAAALPMVIRELVKGPANPATPRLLPADTVVRAVYLLPEGTALVDLGGPTITAGWSTGSHQELMAIYSVVQTASANFPDVKRVRFLVNGTPAETLAGHIWLERSLAPRPGLVAPHAGNR